MQHGYDVVVAAEDDERSDAAAGLGASGREVVPAQVDLSTPEGVTLTSLMPGATDTEFSDRADMEDTTTGPGTEDDSDDVAADGFRAMIEGAGSVAGEDDRAARRDLSGISSRRPAWCG